jgi:hypothetical protein
MIDRRHLLFVTTAFNNDLYHHTSYDLPPEEPGRTLHEYYRMQFTIAPLSECYCKDLPAVEDSVKAG